ncbi:hypothetical protein DFH07DRAFT_961926 [Mycena maculata]|uniref:Uncharacterized protein n=1 Tax=Mycena maculata TaxID=230809 RepID=A0AAD7IS20_9AGAR|nr:hypothetical protein DFH07DRAFT_961926 [Mycena maculata]
MRNQDDVDDVSGAGRSKGGPIPQELKEQLFATLDAYEVEVLRLAEYGQVPETLHKLVGTNTQAKLACALTAWNVWQSWYAENHPKKDFKGTPQQYAAKSRQAFKDVLSNLELKDSDKVFEQLAWLKEWHDQTMANVIVSWRDKGKFKLHVQRAVAPLVHQSCLLHTSLGIHVWGYCIDTQGQASFIWGGTEEFKMWRSKKGNTLNTEIKDMEHLLGVKEMKRRSKTGEAIVMPAHVLEGKNNEKARDTHRHVFGLIMSKQLVQFLVAGGAVLKDYAEKYKMQRRKGRYEDDVMAIMAWDDDEKDLPAEEQGKVSLVHNSDGLLILRVKHSKAFNKQLAGAAKKAATAWKGKLAERDERLLHSRSHSHSLSPGPTRRDHSTSSAMGRGGGSPPTRNDVHHRVDNALKPAPVWCPRSPAGRKGATRARSSPHSPAPLAARHARSPEPGGGAAGTGRRSPPPAWLARSPASPPPPPRGGVAPGVRSALEVRIDPPHIDLLEMATKNLKHKHHAPGATDRDQKRPQKEQGEGPSDRTGQASGSKYRDEEKPKRNDVRMKFKVPGYAKVFRATGFLPTDHPTRADRYTVYESTPGTWITIPPRMTPIRF